MLLLCILFIYILIKYVMHFQNAILPQKYLHVRVPCFHPCVGPIKCILLF